MTDRTPEPQTADLVKRLRAVLDLDPDQFAATGREAADAIEELMAALRQVVDACDATEYEVNGVVAKARALLSKYGASNG